MIMRCAVAARAKRLEALGTLGLGGLVVAVAPWSSQRAGGRHSALGLRAHYPSPPLVGDCSKRCPLKKSFERWSCLGIKLSSPCGHQSEHIEDILKPEKLILSMEQGSTLTSLRPSPRHAATMLLM